MVEFQKSLVTRNALEEMKKCPEVQRKKFSIQFLRKAQGFSSKKSPIILNYLNASIELDPHNFEALYAKACFFLKQPGKKNQKVCLQKAHHLMKQAEPLTAHFEHDFWLQWGDLLHTLGKKLNSSYHFLEAEKKYDRVLSIKASIPKKIAASFFWKRGLNLLEIAHFSGEAFDFKKALFSFEEALKTQEEFPSSFWKEYGKAYLDLALLINDTNAFEKASEKLHKALSFSEKDTEIWGLLGEVHSQLYINTLFQPYAEKASHFYAKALSQKELKKDLWLDWAAILTESGKITKDRKKLQLAVEKCARAYSFSKDPLILAQWVEALSYLGAFSGRLDCLLEAENKMIKVIQRNRSNPDLWYAYSVCMKAFATYYEDVAFLDLAIEKAQEGLSLNRSHAELWHLMGSLHASIGFELQDPDLLELSKKFFYKAVDLKPASPEIYYDFAATLSKKGVLFENREDIETSLFYFEKLLKQQRQALLDHPEWLFQYAYTIAFKGNEEEDESLLMRAVEIFWQALLIDPDYPGIYLQLALCFTHLGEITSEKVFFQKAFQYYSIASKKEEENDQVWLEWGLSLIHFSLLSYEEQDEEMLRHAERILSYAGSLGNPFAYYHLACLYSILNEVDKSIRLFEKAKKMNLLPPLEEILEDEWLDNVRNTEIFSRFLHKLEKKSP